MRREKASSVRVWAEASCGCERARNGRGDPPAKGTTGFDIDQMSIGIVSQKKYLSPRISNYNGDVRKSWTSLIR